MAGMTCGESCVDDNDVVDANVAVDAVDDDEVIVADVVDANVEDNDDDDNDVVVADDDGVDVIAGVDSKRLTSASLSSSTARRTSSLKLFFKRSKT